MTKNTYGDVARFAWRYWRRQPGVFAFLIVGLVVATVFDVLVPVFAGRLIDAVAQGADAPDRWSEAAAALTGLIGFTIAFYVMRQINFLVYVRYAARCMGRVVTDAFYRVQRYNTDWHANALAGSTVRKISRGMWAFDELEDTLYIGFLPAGLVLIGVSIALFMRWPAIGLFLLVAVAIYFAITVVLTRRWLAPANEESANADTALGGALADAVTNNAVVKAFGAEEREDTTLTRAAEGWRTKSTRSWTRMVNGGGLQQVLLVVLQAGLLSLVLWYWWTGQASPGDVAFVMTSYLLINGYLRDLGQYMFDLQKAINDLDDVITFARLPIESADATDARPLAMRDGRIVFAGVRFAYQNQAGPLYDAFSLAIAPGERIALVGRSGSGKSTFVKLLQRLYDVDGGTIAIDGQDIATVTHDSLRRAIAIVPQEPVLFHRTVAENIGYARPDAPREDIERAARLAHAHTFIEALPDGYDTLVGERGVKLSGGERQRVAIARAFLADAPILVLDEATSSLDSETEAHIQQAVRALMEGRTTIIIAHRLSTVRTVDRILVFDGGRIVEQGSHDDLLTRPDGHYRRLHAIQTDVADAAALVIREAGE